MDLYELNGHKEHSYLLYLICSLWIIYMIGCSTIRGLLVFYVAHQFQMSETKSILLYSAYGASNTFACLLGGWLAVNYFGYKLSTKVGLFLYGLGIILIASHLKMLLIIGLTIMAVAGGLYAPNVNSLLSTLYKPGDKNRHAAFTISYTCMNAGALLGYFLSGLLADYVNYSVAFFVPGFLVLFGSILFTKSAYLFKTESFDRAMHAKGILALIFLGLFSYFIIHYETLSVYLISIFGVIIVIILVLIGIWEYFKYNQLSLLQYTGLGIITILFWSFYHLKATYVNFYIKNYVDRTIFHFLIPAAIFQSLNPISMILIGSTLTILFTKINKVNSIPAMYKFIFAIFIVGLAYITLSIGGISGSIQNQTSLVWVIGYFLFISIGEMLIAPTGYAMIGNIFSNEKHQGIFQGIWNIFRSISYGFSGIIVAKLPAILGIHHIIMAKGDDNKVFFFLGCIAVGAAFILALFAYLQKRQKKFNI